MTSAPSVDFCWQQQANSVMPRLTRVARAHARRFNRCRPPSPVRALVLVAAVVLAGVALTGVAAASPPDAEFGPPINETAGYNETTSVTVSDGTLVIRGRATDESGISHLTIRRTYEYDSGASTETRAFYASPGASNGSFEHRVPLGAGVNEVNISVVDNEGIPQQMDVVVTVNDTTPPDIKRLSARATDDGEFVRVEGWVRDNVRVDRLRASGQTKPLDTGKRDLDREWVWISEGVPHPGDGDNETVTVGLVDSAGNQRNVTVPIGGEVDGVAATPDTAAPTPTPTATPTPSTATPNTTTPNTTTATPTATATATPAPSQQGGGLLGVAVAIAMLVGLLVLVGQVTGGDW